MRSRLLLLLIALLLSLPHSSALAYDDAASFPKALATFDLLTYIETHVSDETPDQIEQHIPRYNRREHFGGWIDADRNCRDTRQEALVRDADPRLEIQYRPGSSCHVIKATWHDPYTGSDFKQSNAIQIDHVVPLKNAYISGAYEWQPQRRCTYANFLHNGYHLLAVNGHENMSKGHRGPEEYLPPDESFHCKYVSIWMKIKAVWQLKVTRDEFAAIKRLVQDRACDAKWLNVDTNEIADERAATEIAPEQCQNFGKPMKGSEEPTATPTPLPNP